MDAVISVICLSFYLCVNLRRIGLWMLKLVSFAYRICVNLWRIGLWMLKESLCFASDIYIYIFWFAIELNYAVLCKVALNVLFYRRNLIN